MMNQNAEHISRNFPLFSTDECTRLDKAGYRIGDCSAADCTSGIRVVILSDDRTMCTDCNKELWAAYMVVFPFDMTYADGFRAAATIHRLVETFTKKIVRCADCGDWTAEDDGQCADCIEAEDALAAVVVPEKDTAHCVNCHAAGRYARHHRQGVDLLLNQEGICFSCHLANAGMIEPESAKADTAAQVLARNLTLGREPFYNCEFALVHAQDISTAAGARITYAISAVEFAAIVVAEIKAIGGSAPAPITLQLLETAEAKQVEARRTLWECIRAHAQTEAERAHQGHNGHS